MLIASVCIASQGSHDTLDCLSIASRTAESVALIRYGRPTRRGLAEAGQNEHADSLEPSLFRFQLQQLTGKPTTSIIRHINSIEHQPTPEYRQWQLPTRDKRRLWEPYFNQVAEGRQWLVNAGEAEADVGGEAAAAGTAELVVGHTG